MVTSRTRMMRMHQRLEEMIAYINEKEIPESAAWKITTSWDLLQAAHIDIQKQKNKEWREEAVKKAKDKKLSSVKLCTAENLEDFYEDDDDDEDVDTNDE